MKLSIETYALREKFGDRGTILLAKEAGFDAVDYSYYWFTNHDLWLSQNQDTLGEKYVAYAKELRAFLDEIGMECNQAHAPFTVGYGSRFDESDRGYVMLLRSMESAAILGAKSIIVHANEVPKGVDLEEHNIAFYRTLIPYCEKFGICVAVENLFNTDRETGVITPRIGSPEELNRIVAALDSPYIVACVDVGHAALTGYAPEYFIAGVNPAILKALHIHDNEKIVDSHTIPFNGFLNWEAIMKSLNKIGYDGELTLEIFEFLGRFPAKLMPQALQLAHNVGRHLIEMFEKGED